MTGDDLAARPTGRSEGRTGLALLSLPLVAFLSLPVIALVVAAVAAEPARAFADPNLRKALRLSLETSAVATILAVVLGLPLAYLLARFRFPGREWVDTLVDLPLTLPPVVAGVALLFAFGRMGLLGGVFEAFGVQIAFSTTAVVLAQTFLAAPLFVRAARAGFESVPVALEEAAMTLGRNRWRVVTGVSIPLAFPALAAGALVAFSRAISEFGATMMFAGNLPGVTQTLPLAVLTAMESDIELAVAISSVSLLLAFGSLAGTRMIVRRWTR